MSVRSRTRNPRPSAGLTLLEVVIVVGLVALLVTLAMPMIDGWRGKNKVQRAQTDIITMSMVIDAFWADNGRFPTSLAEIGRPAAVDPWNRPYVYLDLTQPGGAGQARKDHSLVPLNTDYDLYSQGADGRSSPPLTAQSSRDDILRANNGRFVGPAASY